MSKKRRQHKPEFKAKVALEALKGIEPIHALAAKYQIHPTQITTWKQELLVQLPAIFARKGVPDPAEAEAREARLFQKIGQLEVELDWLKKNLRSSMAERRQMIEPDHPRLSTARQCRLLGLPRSSYYHRPKPKPVEDLALMRVIDEVYLAQPVFGSRQMTRWLRRQGYAINRKRVRRLMRLMGLEALYPKPNLSRPQPGQQVYPYLLRHLAGHAAQSGLGHRYYAGSRVMPHSGAGFE